MSSSLVGLLVTVAVSSVVDAVEEEYVDPRLPRTIKVNTPYLLIDDHFIDNRFNEDQISARVPHVLQSGERSSVPLMTADPEHAWEEHGVGYVSVNFDSRLSKFRLYYQIWNPRTKQPRQPRGGYRICYAESADGINWQRPLFDFEPYGEHPRTNILVSGKNEGKAPHIIPRFQTGRMKSGTTVRNLGMLPSEVFRGHEYLMFYCDSGHYLATSSDGLTWGQRQSQLIPNRVDCFQSIVYDELNDEYAIYYRNKLIYGDHPKDDPARGNTRFMSRLSGKDIWTLWDHLPVPVIIPDANDAGRFYNMPVIHYGDLYLGFVTHLAQKPQRVDVELVYSRDGFDWKRLPGNRVLIPCGAEGTWDSGMIFSADRILEVGDEWWLYYTGHNGYHDAKDRQGALGLMRFGKERLVAIQADTRGKESFVVSRPMIWPGGDLVLNADAEGGSVNVAVTDLRRKPLSGYSFGNSIPLTSDATRHKVRWQDESMNSLEGKMVRIEFRFQNADLFAFQATRTTDR
jgi:hypothetical protein